MPTKAEQTPIASHKTVAALRSAAAVITLSFAVIHAYPDLGPADGTPQSSRCFVGAHAFSYPQ
jgi:hypothetical protein